MEVTPQNFMLNSLAGAINSDRRLQCKKLEFNLNGNSQKSITWTKNHVRCNHFSIFGESDLYRDEAFLDFFVSGAFCTPSIKIGFVDLSKAMIGFVQPPDTDWNQPFKARIRTGITNALDGSEDERIACFRPTGAIPVGLTMLAEARKEREIELVLPELEDEEQNFLNGFGELEIS
ncbi:hypothetical protein Ddc_21849 [Ditylenchus destructor]|nr:hypothetical protein Ddc_21849 [Ditylenchus destructor]